MITVIIPAANEEKTIRSVIQQAKRNEMVDEIIVVDDFSLDNTVAEARKEEGVKVITSTHVGKGDSMREGMMMAKNEILVFLDADIPDYNTDIVAKLSEPLIKDEADFVKSYFERQAGRVTEILAKPLLEFFFPHLLQFRQPMSGMVAGKKSIFQKVEFENDYGVDIGLLIDLHHVNARIKEVCIGEVEDDRQPLHVLGRMAKQVANAIFKRVNIFDGGRREEEDSTQKMREQVEFALQGLVRQPKKMIVFDMDHILLQGSFIQAAAEKFGFKKELQDILAQPKSNYIKTQKIARLLEGRTFAELIHVVESIPLIGDAVQVIRELQIRGYVCGIISDSYHAIANHVKNLLGLDFTLGNELEFQKSVATGEVKIPSQLLKDKFSRCEHDHCKSNMFQYILHRFGISLADAVAVGDGENDICMVKMAGTGISFNSVMPEVDEVADYVFRDTSLRPVLEVVR
ncbi:MAG TPA: HAD-IB family phosphatase [Puia sp.]|jgi:phosphoserine phosphatase SerB|nr:HAD-IB family phosphatase [Puia sp.]